MRLTRILWQQRQPMIKFVGRRHSAPKPDHAPTAHPAAPSHSLPESFANYRSRAQSHGPLGGGPQDQQPSNPSKQSPAAAAAPAASTSSPYGAIGGHSAKELGPVKLGQGEVWDRNELPSRFHRTRWSEAEMEAVESAGASMF